MNEILSLSLEDIMEIIPKREIIKRKGETFALVDIRRIGDGRIVKVDYIQSASAETEGKSS